MPAVRRKIKFDNELSELLKVFEKGTSINEEGQLQFHYFDHDGLERILPDAFDVDKSFTNRQVRYLLRQALWNSRKKGTLTLDGVTSEAQRLATEQLSEPPKSYALWTKFRARNMSDAETFKIRWGGVRLESAHHLPRHMALKEFFLNGHGNVYPHKPVFYGHLIARCKARQPENAARQMLDAIDLFMAVFNMYRLFGRRTWTSSPQAEAPLFNGPYQFLFKGKESLNDKEIWYEPEFSESKWDSSPLTMAEVTKTLPTVRKALTKLAKHPFKDVLIDVLKLMQNGMASRDQSYTLLRYWSALERLYSESNSREKSYERIIKRATFADDDKLLSHWIMRHISQLRNEYVHAGDHDDDLHVMSQHLRLLLSRHVNHLLFHAPKVASHKHWLAIVDLPSSENGLREQKVLINQRMRILQQGQKTKRSSK
ncbi:hypothetical protein OOT33_09975 [Sphingobium sp. DEHP117]|uniref:hypothetical protein n=1 Tax=Sphingobium sp. DEHP117 TaxID=2993436 RepID=UPI0027D5A4D1|nr:hypothetical protein [Sphingobium sp. DEHP117]MDQ4420757.1 hypothetical protein [Sphingobium sp. DEHP117]